ncbi:MAG: hypothetical protein EZS28_052085, partial [Streblomastix strix]
SSEKPKIWKTVEIPGKSIIEIRDQHSISVKVAVATQEAVQNSFYAIASDKPVLGSLRYEYKVETISATAQQTLREVQNADGRNKAIAAGRVGPKQVISQQTQKQMNKNIKSVFDNKSQQQSIGRERSITFLNRDRGKIDFDFPQST